MFGSAFPLRVASGQEIIVSPSGSGRGFAAEPWVVRRIARRSATDSSNSSPRLPRSLSDAEMRGRLIDILV
jgi:hypothetical protein